MTGTSLRNYIKMFLTHKIQIRFPDYDIHVNREDGRLPSS